MTLSTEPELPEKPQTVIAASPKRPVSLDWQRECRRFGAWLAGASFVAALAWLTGANAVVPLSDGKVIHAPWVGWPLILMILGLVVGIYTYQTASHERLPVPGRRRVEIDHSFRYSLIFVAPALRFEFYEQDLNALGVQVGIRLSNGFDRPIQVYLEHLEVSVNGVAAEAYGGKVRKMRIMPNQSREFRAPIVREFPQGYFVGLVSYSILYGSLDSNAIYRRRHTFECQVTGVKVTPSDLRTNGPGGNDWTDIEAQIDSDLPEGSKYPDLS